MMIMIVIVPLRTNLSSLYRHRWGLGFTRSRLQGRKHNIRIAKLVFHAKVSPIRTRDGVLSLVSSRSNSPDKVYSPVVGIPPNLGLPHLTHTMCLLCLCGLGVSHWRASKGMISSGYICGWHQVVMVIGFEESKCKMRSRRLYIWSLRSTSW